MIRTQVQLTDQQARALRERANETNRSLAALIREAVDRLLAEDVEDVRWERALAIVEAPPAGYEPDSARDVAREHDRYLAEAYADGLR